MKEKKSPVPFGTGLFCGMGCPYSRPWIRITRMMMGRMNWK